MRTHRTRTALTGLAAAAVLGLAGCGGDDADTALPGTGDTGAGEDTTGEDALETLEPDDELVEPPVFAGGYGPDFVSDVDQYAQQQVQLDGQVTEVIQPGFFAMTAPDDPSVAPLLVVDTEAGSTGSLDPGTPVQVTGTLEEGFDVPTVESDQGVDLDDALFEPYAGQPFVVTDSVAVQEGATG
ncbi:hypothetical protein [Geodermatophilus marinus]|uniref:hypothetical protein n=1 Tax=Geodermatophilus sp. LHW52908 TaxID=2303986 RepID=UPI000E3E3430|nr:hypothetical protein [Geodermatophilus sp. LHW52908]RFU21351.1 hypothetical protein D0Z06_11250 [Geodermatophilus sp. LHW52908]